MIGPLIFVQMRFKAFEKNKIGQFFSFSTSLFTNLSRISLDMLSKTKLLSTNKFFNDASRIQYDIYFGIFNIEYLHSLLALLLKLLPFEFDVITKIRHLYAFVILKIISKR